MSNHERLDMMRKLDASLSKRILTVSPDYKNHRGGIGAIISIYADFFEVFHFIPTYKYHKSNARKILFYIRQLGLFVKILASDREIKIVHIHGSQKGSFYRKLLIFFLAKNVFGKKVIYHNHAGGFETYYNASSAFQKKLIRYNVNRADYIICLSPYWEEYFSKNFTCKKIRIINNVIPDPEYKAPLLLDSGQPLVHFLFLGRIGHNKGIFDIIRMLVDKKDFFSGKMTLSIGGDGETGRLREAIETNGLGNFVFHVGWITGAEKNKLILRSHVYILPSYSEGLPISVLEAMSYGLPIISTPVGGIPEVLKDHINGILVQPGNLEEIEGAMKFFIDNPGKIREFGEASLKGVGPFFPDFVAGQLEEVYRSLLPGNAVT